MLFRKPGEKDLRSKYRITRQRMPQIIALRDVNDAMQNGTSGPIVRFI